MIQKCLKSKFDCTGSLVVEVTTPIPLLRIVSRVRSPRSTRNRLSLGVFVHIICIFVKLLATQGLRSLMWESFIKETKSSRTRRNIYYFTWLTTYFTFQDILGYHTNMPLVMSTKSTLFELLGSVFPSLILEDMSTYERLYPLSTRFANLLRETGYMHIQSTKPDTVG